MLVGRQPAPAAVIIDSQPVKAADTVGKDTRGYEPGRKQKAARGINLRLRQGAGYSGQPFQLRSGHILEAEAGKLRQAASKAESGGRKGFLFQVQVIKVGKGGELLDTVIGELVSPGLEIR